MKSPFIVSEKILTIFVLSIISLYVSTRFFAPALTSIAQGALVVVTLCLLTKNPHNFRRDPIVIIFGLLVASLVATWLSVHWAAPEFASTAPKIDRISKLFLFMPIAWWLAGDPRRVKIFLLLGLIGFMIGCVVHGGGIEELKRAFSGERVDFGIRNAQHPGMVFGTILISCTTLGMMFIRQSSQKAITGLVMATVLTIAAFGVFVTQSRQVWLALAVAAIAYAVAAALTQRKRNGFLLLTAIFAILATLVIGLSDNSIVQHRFDEMFSTFAQIQNGHIPVTSTGIRLQTWLEAFKWIAEKPLLGWDSNASHLVISESTLPEFIRQHFGHLHNYHLELLLSYGLIGLALMLGMYIWVLYSTCRIRLKNTNGNTWFLFAVAFIAYWLTINNFESYNSFWTGVYIHNIVMAAIYTHYLNWKRTK